MSNETKKLKSVEKGCSRVGVMFTDGAMCAPLKRAHPHTGKMEWVWIVTSFTEDAQSYMDGHPIQPEYRADSREELVSDFFGRIPEEKILFSEYVPEEKTLLSEE